MGCNVSKAQEAIAEDKVKVEEKPTDSVVAAAVPASEPVVEEAEKKEGDEDFDVEKFRRANHRTTTVKVSRWGKKKEVGKKKGLSRYRKIGYHGG